MFRFLNSITFSERYGFLIVLITIIVRIFVVSIAWNYGIFVLALKKSFPNSKLFELEWIAGLAQGLGSLFAPLYLIMLKRISLRLLFLIGLTMCSASLFASSFIQNERLLFITYSIPFGFGSALSMFIGTMITGLYFPSNNRFHMLATVSISMGFPLGYLVLNPLTEHLFENHEWHFVKRLYSAIALACVLLFTGFYTDKYKNTEQAEEENAQLIDNDDGTNSIYPTRKFQIMTNIIWFAGLFTFGLAINAIVINLNGFFESREITPIDASHLLMVFGASDAIYRLVLSIVGYFISNVLLVFYIVSGFFGIILTIFWFSVASYHLNYVMTIAFAVCSAVFMSLQYPISAEINGVGSIQKTYTLNVMISGLGVIVGPTISGGLLDKNSHDYSVIFQLSLICFIISCALFAIVKIAILYAASKKRKMTIVNDMA